MCFGIKQKKREKEAMSSFQKFEVIIEPEYEGQNIKDITAEEFKAALEDTLFDRTFAVKEIK